MEQRAAITFCVKLKKLASDKFKMLKSAYDEEGLARTSVFEWHKILKKKDREVGMQKSRVKTLLTAFFMLKVLFFTNLCRKKKP
jgi:hypothetical protein